MLWSSLSLAWLFQAFILNVNPVSYSFFLLYGYLDLYPDNHTLHTMQYRSIIWSTVLSAKIDMQVNDHTSESFHCNESVCSHCVHMTIDHITSSLPGQLSNVSSMEYFFLSLHFYPKLQVDLEYLTWPRLTNQSANGVGEYAACRSHSSLVSDIRDG